MSRTCAPTATNKLRNRLSLFLLAGCLLAGCLLAGCTPVRPILKLGLIAPFEGLYRRTGYAALAAMRAAIADCSPPGLDVLPLALDDSGQPDRAARAAAKLRLDPAVVAVIGPFDPSTVAAAAPQLSALGDHWLVPFAVNPAGGFADPAAPQPWSAPLLKAVAAAAQAQGSRRLVVAGAPPPSLPVTAIPLHFADHASPQQIIDQLDAGDALLWPGDPASAAEMLALLRTRHPNIPFWTAFRGDDPVLTELAGDISAAYWATWSDSQYNTWARTHASAMPSTYLVYRATCQALAAQGTVPGETPSPWQVVFSPISSDLTTQPVQLAPLDRPAQP